MFLELPIDSQLKAMFQSELFIIIIIIILLLIIIIIIHTDEKFYTSLQYRFNKQDRGDICDIYNGEAYKNHEEFFKNPMNISFILNTDGAPVYKSAKVYPQHRWCSCVQVSQSFPMAYLPNLAAKVPTLDKFTSLGCFARTS